MGWFTSKKIIIRPRTAAGDIFDFAPPKAVRPIPPLKSFLFFIIILLWMSFGIFDRDPWKPEETFLSAIALQMSQTGLVLNPMLLGEFFTNHPPLYLWIISLFANSTPLEIHEGARLSNIAILSLAFYFIFYSTKKNYGIRIGWLSVLLVIGTVGFLIRGHQLNFGIAAFVGVAIVIYGYTIASNRLIYNTYSSLKGVFAISAGVLFLLFSIGIFAAFATLIAVCLHFFRQKSLLFLLPFILVIIMPAALWVTSDTLAYKPRQELFILSDNLDLPKHFTNYLILVAWSLFPTLPLAIIAVRLQSQKNDGFFNFLITLSCLLFAYTFILDTNEENLFILLPSITILAARALQKTSDNTGYILDAFAFLVVGLLLVVGIWLFTLSMLSGVNWFDSSISEIFGEFDFIYPNVIKIIAAVALTLLWIKLLFRSRRSNERAIVNWSCGVTVAWILFCLLLLPSFDARKSYRSIGTAIYNHTEGNCIEATNINKHLRSQLVYFGNIIATTNANTQAQCSFLLSQDKQGNVVWQGGRINHNQYYLIKR